MNKESFLSELQDLLMREEVITSDMTLADFEEWDSLSVLSVSVLYDTLFGIQVTLTDLLDCVKVQDLINLAGDKING